MKQVWKCDHCSNTSVHANVIEEHEKTCYMNPAVKDCGTCNNHEPIPYESSWVCKFGFDFEDERTLPCNKWEPKT